MKGWYLILMLLNLTWSVTQAEDGYRLWLRFDKIADTDIREAYFNGCQEVFIDGQHQVLQTAGNELAGALSGLLDKDVPRVKNPGDRPGIIAGVIGESELIDGLINDEIKNELRSEGFALVTATFARHTRIIIAAKDPNGVLYGAFYLLRLLQQQQPLENLNVVQNPKTKLRILNHWDNLDGTVERGYAGFSIWNWHQLPEVIDQRYIDYARANASIGINGASVTNVNAKP